MTYYVFGGTLNLALSIYLCVYFGTGSDGLDFGMIRA